MRLDFKSNLSNWARSACEDWGYPNPPEELYNSICTKLGRHVQDLLSSGLETRILIPEGRSFTLKGLQPGKGPYNWFSQNQQKLTPQPNWEYFVQVAEYIRLFPIAAKRGLQLTFEDKLMDICLHDGDELVVCCEVKVDKNQAEGLIAGIKQYEKGIDYHAVDGGNDPLRKAKYIVGNRPRFFCVVAIGYRREFRVEYQSSEGFQLVPHVIGWI